MKLYRKDEIINKHNQCIVYFSGLAGNTELEKYINLLKEMYTNHNQPYSVHSINKTVKYTIAFTETTAKLFNDKDENIASMDEMDYENHSSYNIDDILVVLEQDFSININ